MAPLITVLTPTYNREKNLFNLYGSLCQQTNSNFLWMIVDDGSEDQTINIVEQWIQENKVKITLLKKENGGKHTALNCGIAKIESELTFIVDSDDELSSEAIECIYNDYKKFNMDGICGIAYLRESKKGGYLTDKLVPYDGLVESFCECRYGRAIKGDMAEVWVTDCLKKYPFPEFKGEKFLSEDVVWVKMAKEYRMIFRNKAIYISDYLEGGLTKGRRKNNFLSPKGCMYRGSIQLEADLPLKYQCRAMLFYLVYGKAAGYRWKELFVNCNKKLLYIILVLPSSILYKKWRGQYE